MTLKFVIPTFNEILCHFTKLSQYKKPSLEYELSLRDSIDVLEELVKRQCRLIKSQDKKIDECRNMISKLNEKKVKTV